MKRLNYLAIIVCLSFTMPAMAAYRTSTATPTPSPTFTPTATATPMLLTGETSDIFLDDFSGTPGAQPAGWFDADQYPDYRTHIYCNTVNSMADIMRTTGDVWGRVVSRPIQCNVNDYSQVEIVVAGRTAGADWKIGVLDMATLQYVDLCSGVFATGTFQINLQNATGWQGDKKIQLQITVEGAVGEAITLDRVRLFGKRRADAAAGFVAVNTAEPDQLSVNGTVVKIKGANYYPSLHGWSRFWTEWDPSLLQTELARTQQMGFNLVRAFVHYDDFGGAAVNPAMLARMEEFVYLAARNNLKVEFTFFPLNRDYSAAALPNMKTHVQTILGRFKGDSRILGWGVTNEIDFDIMSFWGDTAKTAAAAAWHSEIAKTMKNADPQHLVIGATSWPETLDVLDMSGVDVYALHAANTLDSIQGIILRTKQKMSDRGLVRPILFEEICINYASEALTAAQIGNYFQAAGTACYNSDIAGFNLWALNDITVGEPYAPQYCGVFTADGTLRPGANVLATAYSGSNFSNLAPVTRTTAKLTALLPASGQEQILLNTQIPNLGTRWPADNCQINAEMDGVRVLNMGLAGTTLPAYGCIKTAVAVAVNMDQGADLRINVREAKGAWYGFLFHEASGWLVRFQFDCPQTGTFVYNLANYVPPALRTGVQQFKLSVGAVHNAYYGAASSVLFENISVANGARTALPAAPAGVAWDEPFNGTLWVQPAGWLDESNDATFNAQVAYAGQSYGVITRTAESTWGKVLSPQLQINTSSNPYLSIHIGSVSPGATWKLGIQEMEGSFNHWFLQNSTALTGLFTYYYPTVTGWSQTHTFRVEVLVEGPGGSYVTSGDVRLGNPASLAALSPSNYWFDHGDGTPGQKPSLWQDEGDDATFNANLRYSCSPSVMAVTRTAEATWGKVLSPLLSPNVDQFPCVELKVNSLSAHATWKLGIQEIGGAYQHWNLKPSGAETGVFTYNYKTPTGWSGAHNFKVEVILESAVPGQFLEMDYAKVFTQNAVAGSSAPGNAAGGQALKPEHWVPPATPTQNTSAPSPTATPTATPTSTPAPWLNDHQVCVYPNPSKGRVWVAYTLRGAGRIIINIYQITGERVAHIEESRDGGEGQTLTTAWETLDVAPGIYFCRIEITGHNGNRLIQATKKIAIVR